MKLIDDAREVFQSLFDSGVVRVEYTMSLSAWREQGMGEGVDGYSMDIDVTGGSVAVLLMREPRAVSTEEKSMSKDMN